MKETQASQTSNHLFDKHPLLISFFAVLLLVTVAFSASIKNGFVWDDETFIVNNKYVHDISLWPQYFTDPESISDDPVLSRMYRPLRTLSYALDAAIWDDWAGGFHLTSLLLHIAVCITIIFAFGNLIGIKPAVFAASVFAIHPALSEGVLSLASRGNQLYTLFLLLSLGFFVRVKGNFDKGHIFSIITFVLALLSKEPAIVFIALLPFIQIVFSRPWPLMERRSIPLYIPLLITALFYSAARYMVVDTAKTIPFWGGSLWATFQMQSKVFIVYFSLLIWPFNLKGRYSIAHPAQFPDFAVIGALILNLVLLISAILFYRKGQKLKLLPLSIFWFYISLLPVSNIIPVPGSMMGERFIYFTFAGMFPLIAGAFRDYRWRRHKSAVIILLIPLLTAWIVKDISRTPDWKDNFTFFSVLSSQEPDNPVVQIWMAQEELEEGHTTSALKRLDRVMSAEIISPLPDDRAKLHFWYGKALLSSGQTKKAYKEFARAAKLKPDYSTGFALIFSEAAARSGDTEKAYQVLEQTLQKSPDDDALLNGIGNVLIMKGEISRAILFYRNALAINPDNKEAAINLQNAIKSKHTE